MASHVQNAWVKIFRKRLKAVAANMNRLFKLKWQTALSSPPFWYFNDATVIIFSQLDEQDFQKQQQKFSQKLREVRPRLHFEEGDYSSGIFGWIKLYKMQFTSTLSFQVRIIAKELGIKGSFVIPPSISYVTVSYTFPSDEYEYLEQLKKADIYVIRNEEWLQTPPIFHAILEYPRDQKYYVAASLKFEAEEIARKVGVSYIPVYEKERPQYVVVKFSIRPDSVQFLKRLKEEANIQLRKIASMWSPKLPREHLVHYNAINRFKTIATESGISDIVYDMTILSPVFLTYYFSADEYDFEEKLKEANIHFDKYEGDFWMNPKVNEYIVRADLISKVQKIARQMNIDLS